MFKIRIRELRESAGYPSQQAFADAFGVAQSTVGNWEAGKREPNYETTKKLAAFFNVSIDYLLGETDTPHRANKSLAVSDASVSPAIFSSAEEALLLAYRAASPEDRAIIDNIVSRYTHENQARTLA